MASSSTDAAYYEYLLGRRVTAEWCGREIEGTVVDIEAVAGFNERSIDIRIQLGEDGDGPIVSLAPDALRSP